MTLFTDNQMALTRRRLLALGGGATVALYLGDLPSAALASGTPDFLRRSAYGDLTGTSFTAVTPTGATATLTLADVGDLVRAHSEPAFVGRDDAFALTFTAAHGFVLDSAIHELRHATLGRFSVFITPVDRPTGAQSYEVVVDRSVSLGAAQQDAPEPLALSNAAVVTARPHSGGVGAKPRLVTAATIARRGTSLTADVHVTRGHGIVSVRVTLTRAGVSYASASGRLRGKAAVRLSLHRLRRVAAGSYELVVTTTDRVGRRTVTRRRVTVR